MAKNRLVSTSFWSDHYIADLDPTEKLLFLYLLTSERSTLAGVYELPLKTMAVETGIETEMVRKILSRFEEDGKVKYEAGWVAIKNFLKHHEHGSPTVQKGISDAVQKAPDWAKEFIGKGIDTLSPSSSSLSFSSVSPAKPEEVKDIPIGKDTETKRGFAPAKYPNAKEVFRIFGDYPKIWEKNTQFCLSAQWLYEEKGMEELTEQYSWWEKHKTEQFCPKFYNPIEWVEKYQKISDYFDKINS